MSTHTAISYHIVFSTKNRTLVLKRERREELFRYIWGIIYRVNGVEDHLHILSSLHPTASLADFVKDIKTGSTLWIRANSVFKKFRIGRRDTPRSRARGVKSMA
jgi:REP element-mobilizing transposase RayT